jgi:hypothetical protein
MVGWSILKLDPRVNSASHHHLGPVFSLLHSICMLILWGSQKVDDSTCVLIQIKVPSVTRVRT